MSGQTVQGTRLGIGGLVCLVIGNMIGTGIYVSSGYSLSDLRDAKYVLLVWLIAGIHAMCGAVSYAAVANRLPVSGGEYAILSRWVHPILGFLAAWISIVAGFAAPIAISAKLLGAYALHAVGTDLATYPNLDLWIATISLLMASLLHWVQIGWNAIANNIVVSIKLIGLALFLAVGLYFVSTTPSNGLVLSADGEAPSSMHLSQLLWVMLGSLYFTTLSYTGFNASIYLAGEYRLEGEEDGVAETRKSGNQSDPRVGRSMILACFIVTIIYLALNAVFLYSIPGNELVAAGESFVLTVAEAIGGKGMLWLMGWVIVLSTATSVLAMTITGPQVYVQLGRDYGISKYVKTKVSQTRVALIIQTSLAIAFVWLGSMRDLVTYLGLTLTACGAMAIASIWLAQVRNRGVFPPLSPLEKLSVAFYVLGAVVLLGVGYWIVPTQFYGCAITFCIGLALYGIGVGLNRLEG